MIDRRAFLRHGAFGLTPVTLARQARDTAPALQGPPGAGTTADTLQVGTFGAPVSGVGPLDNDPTVIGIERRLHCTCGCTLDVYTCRTTDFSCTVSPAMHRQVVAQVQQGTAPDDIVRGFVTQYGESVLMAPPPRGFSLAQYLVPGFAIAAVALVILAWLMRRKAEIAAQRAPVAAPAAPTDDDTARLRRALDDVES